MKSKMCVSIAHFHFFHSATDSEIRSLAANNFDVLVVSGQKRIINDLNLEGYKSPRLSDQDDSGNMSYYWVKNKGEVKDFQLPWLKIEINNTTLWSAAIEDIVQDQDSGMVMPERFDEQDCIVVFQTKDRKAKIFAKQGKTKQTLEHDILEHSKVSLYLPTSPPYTLKVLQRHTL